MINSSGIRHGMGVEDSDNEGTTESESHKFHLGKKVSKLTDYIFKGKNNGDSHSNSLNIINKSDLSRSTTDLNDETLGDEEDQLDGFLDSQRTAIVEAEVEKLKKKIESIKEDINELTQFQNEVIADYLKTYDDNDISQDQAKKKKVFDKEVQKRQKEIATKQRSLEKHNKLLSELVNDPRHHKMHLRTMTNNIKSSLSSAVSSTKQLLIPKTSTLAGSNENLHRLDTEASNSFNVVDTTDVRSRSISATEPIVKSKSIHSRPDSRSGNEFPETTDEKQLLRNSTESISKVSRSSNEASPTAQSESLQIKIEGEIMPAINELRNTVKALSTKVSSLKKSQQILELAIDRSNEDSKNRFQEIAEDYEEDRDHIHSIEDQLNEFIDLRQNETYELKAELENVEERTDYRLNVFSGDLDDFFSSYHTKIKEIENRLDQLQKPMDYEGLGLKSGDAISSALNIGISFATFLLMFGSAVFKGIRPFIRTKARLCITLVATLFIAIFWKRMIESDSTDTLDEWILYNLPFLKKLRFYRTT
ncbi:Transmembrane and coiled-coil domains protein 3 [Trichoplax sp. H2]|nr:Transmembrane and coiled-coil domains protein 3 [Trichoplax sp. H2]|eukprot:RDD36776.1 Transmembrane and coiled-coil domains protein 3 [Trichoplax sp. H2]